MQSPQRMSPDCTWIVDSVGGLLGAMLCAPCSQERRRIPSKARAWPEAQERHALLHATQHMLRLLMLLPCVTAAFCDSSEAPFASSRKQGLLNSCCGTLAAAQLVCMYPKGS